MQWDHADLVRASGESSSVVSQWLGKGSKPINTIGKIETAIRLERATGFSALWLAKGVGAKRIGRTWPFSADLREQVTQLDDEGIRRLENMMRAHLDMDSLPRIDDASSKRYGTHG